MVNRRVLSLAGGAALLLMTGTVVGLGGAGAQEMMTASHPAHVHTGTCAAPGEVVFPLNDVGAGGDMMGDEMMGGTPMAGDDMAGDRMTGMWMGPDSAVPVEASVTTIDVALADIVSGGHAIVAHESAENIATYIACGDVGGMMLGDDLPVGLAPLNDSGYTGVALLHDNGDGTTTVSLFLTHAGTMMGGMDDMMGTPAS